MRPHAHSSTSFAFVLAGYTGRPNRRCLSVELGHLFSPGSLESPARKSRLVYEHSGGPFENRLQRYTAKEERVGLFQELRRQRIRSSSRSKLCQQRRRNRDT
ncbi:hypothetical protein MRX96_005695 [Rhipicephalus microplus]